VISPTTAGPQAMASANRTGSPAVEVVPMRRRHLRSVLRIDRQSTGDRWSPGLFLAELRRGDADRCYVVALLDGEVVGFAGMVHVDGDGHLTTIATDVARRRQGIGAALLRHLATDARARGDRALTLEVRVSNESAIALYRRFGFAPAGVRKAYYTPDGEDALVLWAEGIDSPAYAERLEGLGR
jgi:[ribosomal protein S18]-alanine N-acetyltransferase